MVSAYHGDSMGINQVRGLSNIEFLVISTETNPVVNVRCSKMKVEVHQCIQDKARVLNAVVSSRLLPADAVVFIGNDVNDLGCFDVAGFSVVPADAEKGGTRG